MQELLRDSSLLQDKGFIDGQFVDSSSKETFVVIDPATNKTIANVANMTTQDAQRAIDSAEKAFCS